MTAPQYGQQWPGPGQPPDNYLVWAILCNAFCCMPLGIVAVIKAAQVNGLWASGQFDAAVKSAQDAKRFAIIGAVIPLVLVVLYFLVVAVFLGGVGAFSGGSSGYTG